MAGPYNGVKGAYQQPSRYGRNESGNYEVWAFEGGASQIAALAGTFSQTPGLMYDVQEGFGKWRLEVFFPWNADGLVAPATDTIVKWELFAQHAHKDLLESQDNAGVIPTISPQQKEVIRQKLLTPPLGTTQQSDFAGLTQPDSGNAQNALTVYTLMQAGQREYLMEAPALRRTIITSNQYAIAYSIFGSRRLWSTNSLIVAEGIPSGLLFNIAGLTAGDISTDANLNYGWYKMFPNVQQVALMKWQITQDWQYGWWSILYGTPL